MTEKSVGSNLGGVTWKTCHQLLSKNCNLCFRNLIRTLQDSSITQVWSFLCEEFVSSALHKNYEENEAILERAFNLIDKDGDGYLTAEELEISFGHTDPEIGQQMLKEADLNGDKQISRSQFKSAMKNISLKSKTDK